VSISVNGLNITFSLSFYDIQEITPDNEILVSYPLEIQNYTLEGNPVTMPDGSHAMSFSYNTVLPNDANVTIHIMTFTNATTIPFGNSSVSIGNNGMKYSMEVTGWIFANIRNMLRIHIDSGTNETSPNACQSTNVGADLSNLHYILITLNGVSLYGKFLDFALLDNLMQNIQYSWDATVQMVAITVPHFWDTMDMDPDFQVLVNNGQQSGTVLQIGECTSNVQQTNGVVTAEVVGIAVGGVVGAAALVGGFLLVAARRRQRNIRKLTGGASSTASTPLVSYASQGHIYGKESTKAPSSNKHYSGAHMLSPLYKNTDHENPLFRDQTDDL